VAINKGTAAATVPIAIAGGTAPASFMTHTTSSSQNLVAGTTPVAVSGGSFSAMLPATSITTFVGN
jgi:O-glycosyl hydrolase